MIAGRPCHGVWACVVRVSMSWSGFRCSRDIAEAETLLAYVVIEHMASIDMPRARFPVDAIASDAHDVNAGGASALVPRRANTLFMSGAACGQHGIPLLASWLWPKPTALMVTGSSLSGCQRGSEFVEGRLGGGSVPRSVVHRRVQARSSMAFLPRPTANAAAWRVDHTCACLMCLCQGNTPSPPKEFSCPSNFLGGLPESLIQGLL